MTSLFKTPKMPEPAPVPLAPTQDPKAEQKRLDAERTAIADSKSRGRASTIFAGGDIASEEQYSRGLLKKKQRAVSREIFG
ncbi:MAG: hypothetical protein ACYCZ0_05150 [Minisyncoccota bacterium]